MVTTVVAAGLHQLSICQIDNLGFRSVIEGAVGYFPAFALIPAVDERGMRQPMSRLAGFIGRVLILGGKDQRSVGHRDAFAGPLQQKTPFRLFNLCRNVDRIGPCQTVVFAFYQNPLASIRGLQSWATAMPRSISV